MIRESLKYPTNEMVINVNDNKSLHFLHGMQIFEKKKNIFYYLNTKLINTVRL